MFGNAWYLGIENNLCEFENGIRLENNLCSASFAAVVLQSHASQWYASLPVFWKLIAHLN